MKQYIDDYNNVGLRTDNGVIRAVIIKGSSKTNNPSGTYVKLTNPNGKSISISGNILSEVITILQEQDKLIHIGDDV